MTKQYGPYSPEGRWRWWYSSISDWMIDNPSQTLKDCAAFLNKAPATIYMIAGTDLFKRYHEQRKAEWRERHDFSLIDKTARVAELGLDIMLETMEKKRDQVPLARTAEIVNNALERLGYGVKAGGNTQVFNGPTAIQQNSFPAISVSGLEEAREIMRVAEAARRGSAQSMLPIPVLEADPLDNSLPGSTQRPMSDLMSQAPTQLPSEEAVVIEGADGEVEDDTLIISSQ